MDPERTPNGPRTDPERIPNRGRTDPNRTPNGPCVDPERTLNQAERTPRGPQTDPNGLKYIKYFLYQLLRLDIIPGQCSGCSVMVEILLS